MTRNIEYSIQNILFLLCTYVIILSINKVIPVNISILSYVLALSIITFNILFISERYKLIEKKIFYLYIISLILIVINVIINKMGFIEIIKIIGSQLFLFVAFLSINKDYISIKKQRIFIFILIFIPLLILFFQFFGYFKASSENRELASIFINRNNAILFLISLVPFLYYLKFKKYILVIYTLFLILLFKTMGALVAFIVAFIYVYKKINIKSLIYLFLLLSIAFFTFTFLKDLNLSSLDRIINMTEIVYMLLTEFSLNQLSQLEYGEAVALTGSSDLSFLFRIKHWSDIIEYYLNASWINQLFGIGIGNIPNITKMELVAHNDFLKLIVEFGPLYFITYIILMFNLLKGVIKEYRFVSIFFVTIFIYFGTENLMNNFLAMCFFYYFLGLYYKKSKEKKYENIND